MKRNADGELLTKSGAVDKRSTKATKKKRRKQKSDEYHDENKSNGIRGNNDKHSLNSGGVVHFLLHSLIYGNQRSGDENTSILPFPDEGHKTRHIMVKVEGKRRRVKVNQGFVLLPCEHPQNSSVTTLVNAVGLGNMGANQKRTAESSALSALKLRYGVLPCPNNPKPPHGFAANPTSKGYIEPENKEHWTRIRHFFFVQGLEEGKPPSFFGDKRTFRGYLRQKNITTRAALLAMKKPLLVQAYLHELNCKIYREWEGDDDDIPYVSNTKLPDDELLNLPDELELVDWSLGVGKIKRD